MVDTFVFQEPNSGVQYRYQGPDRFQPDVYFYPIPPDGTLCQGSCRAEQAEAEVRVFQQSIPRFIEVGYADSIVDLRESTFEAPAGAWVGPGRQLSFRLVQKGVSRDSHLFAFAGLEYFIKFRATFPHGSVPDSTVEAFVRDVLLAAPPPYTCATGYRDGTGIEVSTTSGLPDSVIIAAIDTAFVRMGYTLDFRSDRYGLWRTAPSFAWPADADKEEWHGATSPGVVLFATLSSQEDSIKAAFSSQVACNGLPGKKGQDEASVLQTLTALQLVSAFDSAQKGRR